MQLQPVLTIAGTDPSGGAGVMADLKSFQQRAVYGMAVITSVVAQNTQGVKQIENCSLAMVKSQLDCVYSDILPKAVKTGMLPTAACMQVIKPYLDRQDIPYVMDPVMVATSGDALSSSSAQETLMDELVPLTTLVTPNIPEAETLSAMQITSASDIEKAGYRIIHERGAKAVIIKGGHLEGQAVDYLFTKEGLVHTWTSHRIATENTHGTGCTFSAVITAELGKGKDLLEAIHIGKQFITAAIEQNPDLGHGHGPVNHCVRV